MFESLGDDWLLRAENEPPVCAYCGADIDPTTWHPAVSSSGDPYRIYVFCGENCRDAWAENGRNEDGPDS